MSMRARASAFIAKANDAIARVVAGSVVFVLKTVACILAGIIVAIKLALITVFVPFFVLGAFLAGESFELNITLR